MNQDFIKCKRDELRQKFANAGGDYDGPLDPIEDFLTQSLTEAMEEGNKEVSRHGNYQLGYNEGYAAALDYVEREMPEKQTGELNIKYLVEASWFRRGFNRYRIEVQRTLSRLRGEKK